LWQAKQYDLEEESIDKSQLAWVHPLMATRQSVLLIVYSPEQSMPQSQWTCEELWTLDMPTQQEYVWLQDDQKQMECQLLELACLGSPSTQVASLSQVALSLDGELSQRDVQSMLAELLTPAESSLSVLEWQLASGMGAGPSCPLAFVLRLEQEPEWATPFQQPQSLWPKDVGWGHESDSVQLRQVQSSDLKSSGPIQKAFLTERMAAMHRVSPYSKVHAILQLHWIGTRPVSH
jgi:hypothetical protein